MCLHIRANFARISFPFRVNMLFLSYVFCLDLTFAFSVTMSTQQSSPVSQIGSLSLPDPADGTLGHYQGLALRAGTLEEATYTGGLAVEEVVGWAKGLAMPPQVIRVDMRIPERTGWFGKKGWATHLFRELQVALPGLRAVRLIAARDTVESLLGIMATHTVGKPKPGLSAIYPTTGLVHCPMRMDMIAINNYIPAGEPQANHSNPPFQWQGVQAQWWDDMGILPSHPTVAPLLHIPDITVPTSHRMKGLGWCPVIADPPPFITPEPPLPTAPLQDPPSYATANPSVKAKRPAPRWLRDTDNHGTEMAMKVVRQARLELSGGSTPYQLRPDGSQLRGRPQLHIPPRYSSRGGLQDHRGEGGKIFGGGTKFLNILTRCSM